MRRLPVRAVRKSLVLAACFARAVRVADLGSASFARPYRSGVFEGTVCPRGSASQRLKLPSGRLLQRRPGLGVRKQGVA